MKKSTVAAMVGMTCLALPGPVRAAMSHVMTDPGTIQVVADNFTSSYTNNWTTFAANVSGAAFAQSTALGIAEAQVTSPGNEYGYADFVSKASYDVSRKTEFVLSENDNETYTFNRTMFINAQNPYAGAGFCVEHNRYNSSAKGQIRLSLFQNDGSQVILYDSGNMADYQFEYSFSLIVDGTTGAWAFGWADGKNGVSTSLASGTLTAQQRATYLASPLYVLAGVYTQGQSGFQYNDLYGADVYQVVPEPMSACLLVFGGLGLVMRRRSQGGA